MSVVDFVAEGCCRDRDVAAAAIADLVPLVRHPTRRMVGSEAMLRQLRDNSQRDDILGPLLAWWLWVMLRQAADGEPWRSSAVASRVDQVTVEWMRFAAGVPRDLDGFGRLAMRISVQRRRAAHGKVGAAPGAEHLCVPMQRRRPRVEDLSAPRQLAVREILADLPQGRPTPLEGIEQRLQSQLRVRARREDVRLLCDRLNAMGCRLRAPDRPVQLGLSRDPLTPGHREWGEGGG